MLIVKMLIFLALRMTVVQFYDIYNVEHFCLYIHECTLSRGSVNNRNSIAQQLGFTCRCVRLTSFNRSLLVNRWCLLTASGL